MIEPHRRLHGTATKIIDAHKVGNAELAHKIYVDETVPAVNAVQEALANMKEILTADEAAARITCPRCSRGPGSSPLR